MPEAGFAVEAVCGVPVVVTPDEIDVTNVSGLRIALLDAATHGRGTVVVDMSRTHFCDSAGLHEVVRAHRRALSGGNNLLLVVPATAVLRTLAITGLDRVIPNFPSLDEALTQTPLAASQPGHSDLRVAG